VSSAESRHALHRGCFVSRPAFQIDKEEDHFVILDLDSLNGTFINDVPVNGEPAAWRPRAYRNRSFLFLMHDGDAQSKSSEIKFHDEQVVSGRLCRLDSRRFI